MSGEQKNTDKLLVENIDCRISFTAQHALAIDVGGHVIVCDPLEWHRVMAGHRKENADAI